MAGILDLEPEHTIRELADPTSAIGAIRLESVLCKHDSGLQLLAAPKRIEEAEMISAATVATTLKLMDELSDFSSETGRYPRLVRGNQAFAALLKRPEI